MLCGSQKNKVTVVFDGHSDLSAQILDKSDIGIVFSRSQTADERIKKIVEKCPNTKNIVVVSDDKEITFFVKSCGAGVLNIEEFINRKRNLTDSREKEPPKPELNYSQIHKINQELRQIWLK
jgi:predicted RNA-binding protein with PIN domain